MKYKAILIIVCLICAFSPHPAKAERTSLQFDCSTKNNTDECAVLNNKHKNVYDDIVKNYLLSLEVDTKGLEQSAQLDSYLVEDINHDNKPEIIIVWILLGPSYWIYELSVLSQNQEDFTVLTKRQLLGTAHLSAVKNDIIYIDHVLHAKDDPICCPTIKKQIKYKLQQNKLIEWTENDD